MSCQSLHTTMYLSWIAPGTSLVHIKSTVENSTELFPNRKYLPLIYGPLARSHRSQHSRVSTAYRLTSLLIKSPSPNAKMGRYRMGPRPHVLQYMWVCTLHVTAWHVLRCELVNHQFHHHNSSRVLFSVESKSDSGLVDLDQIPVFQGFKIDSNLFFKIHQMIL